MSANKIRINETANGNISGRVTDNATGDGLLTEITFTQILTDGNQTILVDTTDSDGYYNSSFDYIIVGVTQAQNLPQQFSIGNYPNPYNPNTNLVFSIAESGNYKLEVFDVTGSRIIEEKVGVLVLSLPDSLVKHNLERKYN